jgi:hypothetical protein
VSRNDNNFDRFEKKITVNVESKSKIVTHKLLFIKVTTVMM